MIDDPHDVVDDLEPPAISTLSSQGAFVRTVSGGAAIGGILGISGASQNAFVIIGCAVFAVVAVWVYSSRLARRRAFTEAVENLKPIERAGDDTLFPEEIDPYQAQASWADVIEIAFTGWVSGLFPFTIAAAALYGAFR
jgi:hypothetical protein